VPYRVLKYPLAQPLVWSATDHGAAWTVVALGLRVLGLLGMQRERYGTEPEATGADRWSRPPPRSRG
jgi:hypothetical protein